MKEFKLFLLLLTFYIGIVPAYSEEQKKVSNEHELNFYTGMFDFSDDGKRANLFGIQHQNENLIRDSFLGTLSPVTGFMITDKNAGYLMV